MHPELFKWLKKMYLVYGQQIVMCRTLDKCFLKFDKEYWSEYKQLYENGYIEVTKFYSVRFEKTPTWGDAVEVKISDKFVELLDKQNDTK